MPRPVEKRGLQPLIGVHVPVDEAEHGTQHASNTLVGIATLFVHFCVVRRGLNARIYIVQAPENRHPSQRRVPASHIYQNFLIVIDGVSNDGRIEDPDIRLCVGDSARECAVGIYAHAHGHRIAEKEPCHRGIGRPGGEGPKSGAVGRESGAVAEPARHGTWTGGGAEYAVGNERSIRPEWANLRMRYANASLDEHQQTREYDEVDGGDSCEASHAFSTRSCVRIRTRASWP